MTPPSLLDAAGRRRSPATMPGYQAGRPPRNKASGDPADPPTVDDIVAVMRHTGDDRHGFRLRAMIVVLWRAGLRVRKVLALADPRHGSVLVRSSNSGRRHEVGMDESGFRADATMADRADNCRSVRCSGLSTARAADGRRPGACYLAEARSRDALLEGTEDAWLAEAEHHGRELLAHGITRVGDPGVRPSFDTLYLRAPGSPACH